MKRRAKLHTATSLLFLFASKCFVNGFVERLLSVYIAEHLCVIFSHQQFNTFGLVCKSAEYGTATCMSGIYYFDESMKVYINIKDIRGLHSNQAFNKRVWLMKRKSGHCGTHHFSFGERFDETLMKGYLNDAKSIRISNYQFIGFSSLNKSAGKAIAMNTAIRRLVGRTSVLPTDTDYLS